MYERVSVPAVQTICHLPVLLLFRLVKCRCIQLPFALNYHCHLCYSTAFTCVLRFKAKHVESHAWVLLK